jgi:protein-tyrosine phosphatase
MQRNAVHVLATDAHDTKNRPPVLSTARQAAAEISGEEVARALVDANPRAIISGQPLPYFPPPATKS